MLNLTNLAKDKKECWDTSLGSKEVIISKTITLTTLVSLC